MDERDLVVHDEFITGSAEKCKNQGAQLEQIIIRYIDILNAINADSVMSGDLADALRVLIDSAALLQGTIEENSKQFDYDLRSYVTGINEQDEYLF